MTFKNRLGFHVLETVFAQVEFRQSGIQFDQIGLNWTTLVQIISNLTKLDQSESSLTTLDHIGPNLGKILGNWEHNWIKLDHIGSNWTNWTK